MITGDVIQGTRGYPLLGWSVAIPELISCEVTSLR